jgi:hypothetical protein
MDVIIEDGLHTFEGSKSLGGGRVCAAGILWFQF